MSIQLKSNIDVRGVQSELLVGLLVAEGVYAEYDVDLIITEITGGHHSKHSVHAFGFAADLRTWNLPAGTDLQEVTDKIQERLNDQYDVVLETDHIHIEFDPR